MTTEQSEHTWHRKGQKDEDKIDLEYLQLQLYGS
jgi:hypothetical protein